MEKALDIESKEKKYLDEKELFILYYLLKKKHISTLWSNVFTPNNKHTIHPVNNPGDVADLEERINDSLSRSVERIHSKMQSPVILSYLLKLGKLIDEKSFSIYGNADYSLVEGGFLCNYRSATMYEYLEDAAMHKLDAKKYEILNNAQKDFLEKMVKDKNFNFNSVEFSKMATTPVDEYREAILEKKADKDFIELVNKLITPYDGGRWNTKDAENFLEIYYRHNREKFRGGVEDMKKGESVITIEDSQTKLAGLIFESTDFHLDIKNIKKLQSYLDKYIELFRNDELDGLSKHGLTGGFLSEGLTLPLHSQFFGFKKQRALLIKHIEGKYEEYQRNDLEIGHPYFEPEYIGDQKNDEIKFSLSPADKIKDLFLFVHTMIALEYENYLEIEEFFYGSAGIFDLYERGFVFKIRLKKNAEGSSPSFAPASNKEAQLKALERIVEKNKEEDQLAEKILGKIKNELQNNLEVSNKKSRGGPDGIFYNSKTAIGEIAGREFRFKPDSPAAEVFSGALAMINIPLKRYDVLITSGFYKEGEKSDPARRKSETLHINEIAKTIRRILKIDTNTLVNNDGNLTLFGVKIKSPKVNQGAPK